MHIFSGSYMYTHTSLTKKGIMYPFMHSMRKPGILMASLHSIKYARGEDVRC